MLDRNAFDSTAENRVPLVESVKRVAAEECSASGKQDFCPRPMTAWNR
jgi:hypothetical protein